MAYFLPITPAMVGERDRKRGGERETDITMATGASRRMPNQ